MIQIAQPPKGILAVRLKSGKIICWTCLTVEEIRSGLTKILFQDSPIDSNLICTKCNKPITSALDWQNCLLNSSNCILLVILFCTSVTESLLTSPLESVLNWVDHSPPHLNTELGHWLLSRKVKWSKLIIESNGVRQSAWDNELFLNVLSIVKK